MGILQQFKLAAATPQKATTAVDRFRRRMTDAISLQIDIAKADAAGQAFTRLRQKWVKNPNSGEKELRNVPITIRRWWWTDDNGVTFAALKYGAKTIELAPGKNAIEIGSMAELSDKLALLRDAIRAGELDAQALPADESRGVPKPAKAGTSPGKAASGRA